MSSPRALLTAQDCTGQVHLIIGSNPLASARCAKTLEVGAVPKVVAPSDAEFHYVLTKRIEAGEVEWLQKPFKDDDLTRLGRSEADGVVDAVFITSGGKSQFASRVSGLCRRLRIPVNVVDAPNLCTFTLLATHTDGPLQIGVTTSGKGCKLASRIRREVVASLPRDLGSSIERLGKMRQRVWEEDHRAYEDMALEIDDDESIGQKHDFNQLILPEDQNALKMRRMRWISQICEYWPLKRLASITDHDIETMLHSRSMSTEAPQTPLQPEIILAGSGPGSPLLLTLATHRAIKGASVILADKLVPAPILDLIPRRTPVHIARKFPGNADNAQAELLEMGLEALKQGHTVLRLKQGDPFIYGRGAEEVLFFREHGYEPIVLPGITSALSAPLFAKVTPTHRGVADQVLICTGTGRKGAAPDPPSYRQTKTVVFLMALHRLQSLIMSLTARAQNTDFVSNAEGESRFQASHFVPWPSETPCAVIERASCPDQRVIRSTLAHVCRAVEEEGSRPPGLLVLGWGCNVLRGESRDSKEQVADREISYKTTTPMKPLWTVEEGFSGLGSLEQKDLIFLFNSEEAYG